MQCSGGVWLCMVPQTAKYMPACRTAYQQHRDGCSLHVCGCAEIDICSRADSSFSVVVMPKRSGPRSQGRNGMLLCLRACVKNKLWQA